MNNKKAYLLSVIIGGLFLFIDQLLKYFAQTNPNFTFYLWKSWLGWEYFANTGIAFSLPFPNILLIIFSPLIILALFIILSRQKNTSLYFTLGVILIIAGAISNLIDRILFAVTIDYLRVLTGVINLADVMIVLGAGLLLLKEFKKKEKKQ